ncbi:MAG: CpXC domain-containing protein [Lachnospiraceae bacterium]|nr:CpXC domain-containing protein [Lachnospiraceae bacterium]
MKSEREITCTCSKCGETEKIYLPQVITEQQRWETEDLSLFKWTCPKCGHVLKLLYPCMYLDKEKKILVWYVDEHKDKKIEIDVLQKELAHEFQEEAKGYTKRFCCTLEEFGEKVRVLEQGLDDKVIELLKIMTFARLHISDKSIEHIYYYRRDAAGNYEFTIIGREGTRGITLNHSMYQDIEDLVQEKMEADQDRFYCIDPDWAGQQIVQM